MNETAPKRNFEQELLESIEEVKAYKCGKIKLRTTIYAKNELENIPSHVLRRYRARTVARPRGCKGHIRGEIRLRTHTLVNAAPPAEIRRRLNLSQDAFAGLLGVSVRTLQEWEQGRRQPRGPAQALLRIADQHPEAFLDLR